MSPSPELKRKLKLCEPEIKEYVAELELENAKLQKQVAKLEVGNISSKNRVVALQTEIKKLKGASVIGESSAQKWFNK